MKFYTKSLRNFKRTAKTIIANIKTPSSIILKGDLGSGKTTLTNFLGKSLRIVCGIASPTFTIVQSYKGKKSSKSLVVNHFDLYRINNEDELYNIGYSDYFQGHYLNFFEWGESYFQSISSYSKNLYLISFTIISENERLITFECLKQN